MAIGVLSLGRLFGGAEGGVEGRILPFMSASTASVASCQNFERLVKFYSVDPKVGRPGQLISESVTWNKLRVACGPVRLSLERSSDVAVECSQLNPATFDDDSIVFLFESQFKSSMAGTIK